MPKKNCKYWDKCYQKNNHHLQKYNHPNNDQPTKNDDEQVDHENALKHNTDVAEQQEPTTSNKTAAPNIRQEIDSEELRQEALANITGKNYMEVLQKRIKLSVQAEYDELLRSDKFIYHKFLVEMPPDFYEFWKFVNTLKKDAGGEEMLEHLQKLFQLQLVGPFEFLAGRFHNAAIREPGDYLRHWRFFYDPPEFQTIFVRRGTGVHYGYWRDTPQDKEGLLIARNDATKNCEFEFVGGNAFDAFLHFLKIDIPSSPFTATSVANIKKAVEGFIQANELCIGELETLKKARNLKVVAKTFHRAGIVVPFDSKSQVGYRPLIVSDAELKQTLQMFEKVGGDEKGDGVKRTVFEKVQPVATAATIAMDECDFGTALELGIDLFCCGRLELHMLIQSLLVPAYTLLHRPQFIAISKAHLENRQKNVELSIFDLDKNKISQ